MAYVLDTDSTSNFLEQGRNTSALRERVTAEPPADIYSAVITLKEVLGGILNALEGAECAAKRAKDHPLFCKTSKTRTRFSEVPNLAL